MRISVIIPVKDRPVVIRRAIKSIFQQTLQPIEIIVVDDGSTDNTADVVDEIRRSDPRIILVRHATSLGAPVARNMGASIASGDAIAFLDSDDCWKPEKLELQAGVLSRFPSTPATFCGIEFIGGSPTKALKRVPAVVHRSDLFARNVLGGCSGALVQTSSFLLVGGFDPTMPACQDWELWLRLSSLGPIVSDPSPLVEYYFDGSARISKSRSRVEEGHRKIFALVINEVTDPSERRKLNALHSAKMADIYSKQSLSPRGFVRSALRAIACNPTPSIILSVSRALAVMLKNMALRSR